LPGPAQEYYDEWLFRLLDLSLRSALDQPDLANGETGDQEPRVVASTAILAGKASPGGPSAAPAPPQRGRFIGQCRSKLVDVLTRKKACDVEVSRINASAPAGVAPRLREVELVARNIQNFTRDQPSITNELQLPDWDQPAKLAWPPPQTPLASLAVQGMAAC
jgi:hypothetical protein